MELMKTSIKAILDNIVCAEEFLDENAINEFEDIIMNSKNVFVTGAGRSGLAAKAFAMRLMHLGISSYVVGETISPAIYDDDCIIAISGSGEKPTLLYLQQESQKIGVLKYWLLLHILNQLLANWLTVIYLLKEGLKKKWMIKII